MADNRKLKVFLCHSKDDKSKVRYLYYRLSDDGFDPWLDEEKLIPGQDWDLEIRKAVRQADVVAVCISNDAITKAGYVQKEIRLALDVADEKPEGTIFLIPVRLEDCNVPNRISRFQWVDLFDKAGYSKLKEALNLRMKDLNIRFDLSSISPKTSRDGIRIPILGPISTELPLPDTYTASNKYEFIEVARDLLPSKTGNLFALQVVGYSMQDAMINNDDIVVLEPASQVHNGEMAAIWLPRDNEAMLKYYYEEENRYRLLSASPNMKPVFVRKSEPLEIKGKVIMVIRQTRIDNVKLINND
jgi:SOS-response transcriptional repressor LexA